MEGLDSGGVVDGLDQGGGGGRVWRLAVRDGVELAAVAIDFGAVNAGSAVSLEGESWQGRDAYAGCDKCLYDDHVVAP